MHKQVIPVSIRNRNKAYQILGPGTVLLSAVWTAPALAADYSWNTGSGFWGVGTNWNPKGPPPSAATARIGNLGDVENETVTLQADDTVAELHLTDGMILKVDGGFLTVTGDTFVTGSVFDDAAPRIQLFDAAGVEFSSDNLTLSEGGRFELNDDSRLEIHGLLKLSDSDEAPLLAGDGNIALYSSGRNLDNNGIIRSSTGVLRIMQSGDGRFDLDGAAGNGELAMHVSTQFGTLEFVGEGLHDPFSSTIRMAAGSVLDMDLEEGWVADSESEIKVTGFYGDQASKLRGKELTFSGLLEVDGLPARLDVQVPMTIEPAARVEIGYEDILNFGHGDSGPHTIVNGGEFTVGQGGELNFMGWNTMYGGVFNTYGVEDEDGDVDFDGPTDWAGEVTFHGRAQVNHYAHVIDATVIHAELFDWNGEDGDAYWDVNAPITINADSLKTHGFDFFEGVLNIDGGLSTKVTINLSGEQEEGWSMRGTMNLNGSKFFFVDRLAGAFFINSGEVNISDSKVEVSAGAVFFPWGTTNFEAATSSLRLRDWTLIREGATFNGQGTLINGVGGEMEITDTAALNEVGLINQSYLWIYPYPNPAGQFTADRFSNEDKGTLSVRIQGYEQGVSHDHLLITGGDAQLAGTLEVNLADLDGNLFEPEVGDEFTILTAAGSVMGAFANVPAACVNGNSYEWTVEYGAHNVVLRVAAVTPHLGDMNCDCSVDFDDIDPFVIAMISEEQYGESYPGCSYMNGDTNGDGSVDFDDIDGFVALLID